MRVSACGFASKSLEEAQDLAVKVTEVSHNHPESIKAAKAVASAIYMAMQGRLLEILIAHLVEIVRNVAELGP